MSVAWRIRLNEPLHEDPAKARPCAKVVLWMILSREEMRIGGRSVSPSVRRGTHG